LYFKKNQCCQVPNCVMHWYIGFLCGNMFIIASIKGGDVVFKNWTKSHVRI
jgi:hypothetical protein